MRRALIGTILVWIGFLGSCAALLEPARRLADPMTHRALSATDVQRFPLVVVREGRPELIMLTDLRQAPALPAGATFLIPSGKEKSFEQYLYDHAPHGRDSSWVIHVDRMSATNQRIELYLFGDGYWGGAYDATASSITPLYRKITGPGFAFIVGGLATLMNLALWAGGRTVVRAARRRWTA